MHGCPDKAPRKAPPAQQPGKHEVAKLRFHAAAAALQLRLGSPARECKRRPGPVRGVNIYGPRPLASRAQTLMDLMSKGSCFAFGYLGRRSKQSPLLLAARIAKSKVALRDTTKKNRLAARSTPSHDRSPNLRVEPGADAGTHDEISPRTRYDLHDLSVAESYQERAINPRLNTAVTLS